VTRHFVLGDLGDLDYFIAAFLSMTALVNQTDFADSAQKLS
jgi:hypothetical protein